MLCETLTQESVSFLIHLPLCKSFWVFVLLADLLSNMGNSSSSEQAAEAPKPVELAPNGEPKPKCPMCVCKELRAERDSCMLEHEDGKTVSCAVPFRLCFNVHS